MKYKTYPKMKDSGVEGIGEVPDEWSTKKLKFSVLNKTLKSQKKSNLPYVGLENVESDTGLLIDINEEMEESDAKLFQKNDILFGKLRPYLAKVAKMDFDGRCSGEFLVLQGKEYEGKFLQYLLLSDGSIKTVNASTYGSKMPRAEWSFIGNMKFPILKTETQIKIINFLKKEISNIDSEIFKNEKLIKLVKEKQQVVISQAVTKGIDHTVSLKESGIEWIGKIPKHWNMRKITHSVNKITNGFVGPTRDILLKDGVRYLQSLHIKKGEIKFIKKYFVSDSWSKEHSKSILKEGDVLVVQTGGIGECATVTKEFEGCNCHALIILQFKKELANGFFISYLLRSNYGFNIIDSNKTGALLPHLEIGYLKDVFLPLPPNKEQDKIVDYLNVQTSKTNYLIYKVELHVEKLKEIKKSLILSSVTGKICVTN